VVSVFKERSGPAVFSVIALCLALHAFLLATPPAIVASPNEGLMYYVLQPLSKLPALAVSIIYFIIVIVQAFRINYVLNDAHMFQKSPFVAALAYILLTALWPPCNNITAALVVNGMLIWLLFRFVKLYRINQPKALIYNIGVISGGTALLYYPALGIIPLVFIALGAIRAFRLNEWMVLLLGIATPFYFWCCWLYLTDGLGTLKTIAALFELHRIAGPVKPMSVAFAGAGLLLIAGGARLQANRNMLIQARKTWLIVFCMLLLLLAALFIIKNAWPYAVLTACVPAAAITANAFLNPRSYVATVLFWLMVAAIVYVNWAAI
jgi:hypothetical protein